MKKMYDNINHFSEGAPAVPSVQKIQPGSLMQMPATQVITADYFVQHYIEFLPRYIANGNPSRNTLQTYCSWIDHFISWCLENKIHEEKKACYMISLSFPRQ